MAPLHPPMCFFAIVILSLIGKIDAFTHIKFPSAASVTPRYDRSALVERKTRVSSPRLVVQLQAWQWPTLPWDGVKEGETSDLFADARNGLDDDYPWRFEGRFIFRPSLVRTPSDSGSLPPSASLLSLFGYTLGGSVVLEYDVSPVGPYREYVTMGGVVGFGQGKGGNLLGIGQWGTDLYVTTEVAEKVCQQVWGVPAQLANIDLVEEGDRIEVEASNDDDSTLPKKTFTIGGWSNTRVLKDGETETKRYGGVPIFWTPTIKALWAPLAFSAPSQPSPDTSDPLPVHRLRLSASALRVKSCAKIKPSKRMGEIPIGLALVVDNVLIEIGEEETEPLGIF